MNDNKLESEIDIRTYLAIARRRVPHLLVPFVVLFVIACTIVYIQPPLYHSSAKILVESQQIPDALAQSTVTSAAAERIQIIRQRLMTRSNLLEIVNEFDLFTDKREQLSPTKVVELMRKSATIAQIDLGGRHSNNQQVVAFTVSFEYKDSKLAARVANKFVELILEQNIQSRTSRASKTYSFFERQVDNLEKQLALKEAAIVKFKSDNEAALPDSLAYRRALLTDLQSRIQTIEQKVQTLTEQHTLLKRGEEVVVTNPIAEQLAVLRVQVQQLRESYSDRHPSVKRVQNRIAALEKVLRQNASLGETESAKADAPEKEPILSREAIDKLASIERQLTALTEQRRRERERISELEVTLAKTPQIELLLNSLTREYTALEMQLSQARSKMAQAATGEQLEEDRQAERFEVIEQATAPGAPSKPDRPKLVLAGFVVSVAAGVGMVLLFEMLDRSIRTAGDLQSRLQMRPLSTIPLVITHADRRNRSRKIVAVLIGLVILSFLASGLVHVFYKPLDIVWIKVMQRIPF